MTSRALFVFILLAAIPTRSFAADCAQPPQPGVDWQRCYLMEKNLEGHHLDHAKLVDASFERALMARADLTAVTAYHAKFLSTDLTQAHLDDGNFVEADFTKAILAGASLKGADLRRARFFKADLRGANLTGAKTNGADWLNADLSGAIWTDGKLTCAAGSIGQCN